MKRRLISPFSKFRLWCLKRRIPIIIFPILAFIIVAVALVVTVGVINHWDFAGALTSKTAILIYAFALLIAVYAAYYILSRKR